jgi:hypothetical protein
MMHIYISGPITRRPNLNREAFASAAEDLRARGLHAVNPHEIKPSCPDPQWIDYMRADIPWLLICDEIHMLPGWLFSRGARIEILLALLVGIKIRKYRRHL